MDAPGARAAELLRSPGRAGAAEGWWDASPAAQARPATMDPAAECGAARRSTASTAPARGDGARSQSKQRARSAEEAEAAALAGAAPAELGAVRSQRRRMPRGSM